MFSQTYYDLFSDLFQGKLKYMTLGSYQVTEVRFKAGFKLLLNPALITWAFRSICHLGTKLSVGPKWNCFHLHMTHNIHFGQSSIHGLSTDATDTNLH